MSLKSLMVYVERRRNRAPKILIKISKVFVSSHRAEENKNKLKLNWIKIQLRTNVIKTDMKKNSMEKVSVEKEI